MTLSTMSRGSALLINCRRSGQSSFYTCVLSFSRLALRLQADNGLNKSTVLLNANVAFLSIPDNINGNNNNINNNSNGNSNGNNNSRGSFQLLRMPTTPMQLTSCLSIMARIGSIILGLLLIRENRNKAREDAGEAV